LRSRYLVDKSALARMTREPVRRRLAPIIEAGDAATCALIELEVLYSARTAKDYEAIRHRRRLAYEWVPISNDDFERALRVQALMAKVGHHRVPIPDLVIAAVAERARLTVLHYDADFETIARVTGQKVEWVVRRGSVD
jgi:predicted nucleic acid-binding protein